MVDRRYEAGRNAPPASWKRFLDQQLTPAAIDAAGRMERSALVMAERGSVATLAAAGIGAAALGALLVAACCGRRMATR